MSQIVKSNIFYLAVGVAISGAGAGEDMSRRLLQIFKLQSTRARRKPNRNNWENILAFWEKYFEPLHIVPQKSCETGRQVNKQFCLLYQPACYNNSSCSSMTWLRLSATLLAVQGRQAFLSTRSFVRFNQVKILQRTRTRTSPAKSKTPAIGMMATHMSSAGGADSAGGGAGRGIDDTRKGQGNRLGGENSPYLLQHAHNPVDWMPWGEDAFRKAKAEDKPIFLSVGYSTCHW